MKAKTFIENYYKNFPSFEVAVSLLKEKGVTHNVEDQAHYFINTGKINNDDFDPEMELNSIINLHFLLQNSDWGSIRFNNSLSGLSGDKLISFASFRDYFDITFSEKENSISGLDIENGELLFLSPSITSFIDFLLQYAKIYYRDLWYGEKIELNKSSSLISKNSPMQWLILKEHGIE